MFVALSCLRYKDRFNVSIMCDTRVMSHETADELLELIDAAFYYRFCDDKP